MPNIVITGKPGLFTAGVQIKLVELPESPVYTFEDRVKCVRRYQGQYDLCLDSALYKGRDGLGLPAAYNGLIMSGYTVEKCTVTRRPRMMGEVTVEWIGAGSGGTGQALTPDTWALTPTELNPRLELHPRYTVLPREDRDLVRLFVDSSDAPVRADAGLGISISENSDLAGEMADKLLTGLDSYYLPGWTFTWIRYFWEMPVLSKGGVRGNPAGPISGELAAFNLEWLRKADECDFDGIQYRLTAAWMGADKWDHDLYPAA